MSVEAMSWALRQPIRHSSAKFVLVVLADCADKESGLAWPSMAHLCEATSQDRKTVISNLSKLRAAGYIEDSGERKGTTKQVVVYRLNSTGNGTVKESQNGNSSESGTVPETDGKSPVFPVKESRFYPETGPKTGHGTIRTIKEPSENKEHKRGSRLASDWSLPDDWRDEATAIGIPAGAMQVEADKFRDYWTARAGAGATKHDWRATWRNWCRSAVERTYRQKPGKQSRHDLSVMDYTKGVTADGRF